MRPLIVADARSTAPFRDLAVTRDVDIGSYVGVPIVLSGGRPYGTLCAIDPESREVSVEALDRMRLLARFVASLIDTERLQEDLRASEEKYRRVFESVQDVFYQADMDGRITEISPSVTRFSGFAREELIGQPVVDLYVDPRQRDQLLMDLVRTGEVTDYVVRLKDVMGRTVHTSVNAHFTRDAAGSVVGVEGSMRDVTNRVLAEEELRWSEERYRALLETANDLIQSVTPDGRIVYANPAWRRALGYTETDLGSLALMDVIHPSMREHCAERFARVLRGEDIGRIEVTFVSRDGREIEVEGSVSTRLNDDESTATMGIFRDVSARRAAERALRASEERLRSLFDNSLDAILLTSPDGGVLAANPAACRMFGRSEAEIIGVGRAGLVDGTDPRLPAMLAERERTGRLAGELTHVRADGSRFPGEVSSVLYSDSTGRLVSSTFIRDVTERERASTALRESEARVRTIFAVAAEGIVLQDATGAIQTCNASAEAILGLTVDQMAGRTSLDPRWRSVREDGSPFPGDEHPAMVALRTGRPVNNTVMGVHKPDGSLTWIAVNARPVLGVDGAPTAVVASFFDVTEAKRTADELARLYGQSARQVQSLRELIRLSYVVSSSLRIDEVLQEIAVAAAELTGVPLAVLALVDEARGLVYPRAFSDPAAGAEFPERSYRIGEGGVGHVAATRQPLHIPDALAAPGGVLPAAIPWLRRHGISSFYGLPIMLDGAVAAVLILNGARPFDLDADDQLVLDAFAAKAAVALRNAQRFEEIQAARAELDRLNRVKSDFVSMVSHEFRTALTGIQGFSEMMRDEDFSIEEMKEFAADINSDAKRLNRMITEMLDLDRMESGRLQLRLEEVDLAALLAEVAERFRPDAPTHPIVLGIDDELPAITGDRDKLVQVFTNLLSNAVKYSPAGGDVAITACQSDEAVRVSVRDRGIGIPVDRLESIFERYQRVDTRETRGIKGTGLGLPIVRQIVQLHGGRAWAESTVGQGTTIHLVVPIQAGAAAG